MDKYLSVLISRGISATGGTSADNGDYMNINQLYTFNNDVNSLVIPLTIFDDDEIESNESFIVTVVPVSTDDLTVDPDELTVTIEDDDCKYILTCLHCCPAQVNPLSCRRSCLF